MIERLCVIQALDQGFFSAAFTTTFPKADDFRHAREGALRDFAELTRRARRAGRLRPDFVFDDLILVLMANGGIRTTSPATAVAASRRFAAMILDPLRARPDSDPLPPPVRLPLPAAL